MRRLRSRVFWFARRDPSAILLSAQLAGVLLYPFMESSDVGRALFSVFGILILGLVVLAVRSTPGLTWVGLLLGLPATVLLLIQAVTGRDDLLPYSSALEALLYFYAAGALIAYMLADHEITRDELFAVGATFTLVAWAFAYSYTVCQAIEPGSFIAAIDPDGRAQLDGAAVPELHDALEHRPERRRAGQAVRPRARDDRAARGRRLRRDGRLAARRPARDARRRRRE